jgi:hypothetical protein
LDIRFVAVLAALNLVDVAARMARALISETTCSERILVQ